MQIQTHVNPQSVKPTRARYGILLMLFLSVVINYMDRANIALAAPLFGKDLNFSSVQMGLIFSAFGWTYAFLQIPGGWLVDRFKTRGLYFLSLSLWSLATLLQSFVNGFNFLFGLRLTLGVFEAPAYPMNTRVVTSWFPDQERASAIGIYTSGQFVGLAFLTPILMYIQNVLGWREMLFITGLVGLVWSFVWYSLYREPKQGYANQGELEYIKDGGGLIDWADSRTGKKTKVPFNWSHLKLILSSRDLLGVYIGYFCLTGTLWFFLTWFPTYLIQYRHIEFTKVGLLASLPFMAAFVGVISSGFLSDQLVKMGVSIGTSRKTPMIGGLLLSISIIGANYVQNPTLIIAFMAVAFFGNGLASIGWIFVSSIAPKNLLGLTGGIFNFIGNLQSILVPIFIGFLIRNGDFSPALIFVATLALIGALSFIFIVRKVERIEIPE
jgi:ACS family D-galactonate transporter-like MFS transporter